jgi:glycosyltransferase involved in cell wall biosynthesis
MKIAQISKADAFGGGASRVAEDLATQLNKRGFSADHWVSWSGKGYDEHRRPLYGKHERWVRKAHSLLKRVGLPEVLPLELATFDRHLDYDLLHFHDLSSAIAPATLYFLSRHTPVLWTLHDCSPFTGGCLYPMDCNNFRSGCGNCPQLGEWPIDMHFDTTRLLQSIKRSLHQSRRIKCVTPSNWMADLAVSSGLLPSRPIVLANGVDVGQFHPYDRGELRRQLGIPENRFAVLISAGNILDERKGTTYALEALHNNSDLKPFLVVVGALDDRAKQALSMFDYISPGYVGSADDLARFYSSADVFLFCSLADNQPLAILETMACGTPLVGFATGGIPEMVEQARTGYLVAPRDVTALSKCLRELHESGAYKNWGPAARDKACAEYSQELHVSRHLQIYESTILEHLN